MEFANIVTLINALLWPLTIGSVGAYIAWQQYKINKTKVQFELYDKRFAIYDTIVSVINTALWDEAIDNADYRRFLTAYNEANFLLPDSVLKRLEKPKNLISEYELKKRKLRRYLERNKGDLDEKIQITRDEIISIEEKLEKLPSEITAAFMKVLKFEKI